MQITRISRGIKITNPRYVYGQPRAAPRVSGDTGSVNGAPRSGQHVPLRRCLARGGQESNCASPPYSRYENNNIHGHRN